MYTNDRNAYRQTFINAWQKHLQGSLLEPIEDQLVKIILKHPEFQPLLSEFATQEEYELADNPFFHMSLHLALQEQVNTNRPVGIRNIYQDLLSQYQNAHEIEHQMMQCLANIMLSAQTTGIAPSEEKFLEALRAL